MDETMKKRNKHFEMSGLVRVESKGMRIHNHLPNNYIIGNKKALYYTMSRYYEANGEDTFNYLPLTFHIHEGIEDNEYLKFLNKFYDTAKSNRRQEREN